MTSTPVGRRWARALAAFPFVSLPTALLVLRVTVAGCFMAHGIVRVVGGTVGRFAGFLEGKGLPFGEALVWAITAFEVLGGGALAFGVGIRPLAAGLFALLAVGIGLIHAGNGWFVGEHGTGGMEYSVVLMACLGVIGAAAPARRADSSR